MTKQTRQLALLAVLVVIFGWLALRPFGGGSSGRAASVRGSVPSRQSLERGEVEVVRVRLGDLLPEEGTESPGRNPFIYRPAAKPPPRPRPVQRPPRPQTRPQPNQAQRAEPPAPRPPAVDFVYLGSFGAKERKIAVFSDNKEIYNVLEGGVVKERFVVRSIGLESADIGFVNFPNEPAKRLAAGG